MTKRFVFDFHYRNSHRIIVVNLRLRLLSSNKDNIEFTASNEVYTSKTMAGGSCIMSGQCMDVFANTEVWEALDGRIPVIYNMWKKHHLNGMHPSTEAQENALKNCESNDYEDQCRFLKDINLYVDNGHRYGSAWLFREIPAEDMQIIESLMQDENGYVDIKVTKSVYSLIDEIIREN